MTLSSTAARIINTVNVYSRVEGGKPRSPPPPTPPPPGARTCLLLLALLLLGLLHGEEDPHAAERHHLPVGQGDHRQLAQRLQDLLRLAVAVLQRPEVTDQQPGEPAQTLLWGGGGGGGGGGTRRARPGGGV